MGIGTVQAAATTAPPQNTSIEEECEKNAGKPFNGFRQEYDYRTEARMGMVWNYCRPEKDMFGYAEVTKQGRASEVWFERATEGPNPATWTGPHSKKAAVGWVAHTETTKYGDYWWRACADITSKAGAKVRECSNWYQPSTMFTPVPR
ncbi:hypothetical protein [Streptomyces ficellus]|uniref:Uncharacterized protein n=1 Tax=Streptomyces ficellus TaxID=1977088 RepID=A0A6I6F2E5_9ACTN|nr:hypothetical protein [Streptomyces ficellus]QGV78133.1 hypothetical protein EIZ62_07630 [Streptomyces ficellus]